jgi:polar amino acid transport system substrate-binding protein
MRRAAVLLLVVALLSGRAAADGPVVIVTVNRVPMAHVENGRPTGVLVELSEEAFRRAGRQVEIRLLPWPRCLAEMRTGEADAILTIFRTPQREALFAFTDEEVLQQTESLFVRKGSPIRFGGDLSVLAGKRTGVVYQTSYGPRLDQALADGLFGAVETERNMADLVKMLAHGRIDVLPGDRGRILGAAATVGLSDEIAELTPPVEVTPGYLAFTRARDERELGRSFDEALRAMKKDGTYAAILARYPNR